MKTVAFRYSIDASWLAIAPILLGSVPSTLGTPDQYVTVEEDGQAFLRIDLYGDSNEAYAFQDAMVWKVFVVIGFGESVFLINYCTHQVMQVKLGSYFGYLQIHGNDLLIASAERVFCLDANGNMRWRSVQLGIDGVVLHESSAEEIRGEGEWDPPGGWKSFTLAADSGALL